MPAGDRPDWITTVGDRKKMEARNPELAMDRVLHYREVGATRYMWDGLPEQVPPEYPELAIFDCGGIGRIEYGGQKTPFAGRPALRGALGEILRWTPQAAGAFMDADLLRERSAFEDPYVIIDRIPLQERIRYYCEMQARALNSLKRNLLYMVGPVIMQSVTGGEVTPMQLASELRDGAEELLQVKGASVDAKVLDLGGADHTQNLITTINQLDSEILSIMGIPALGTSKTSGISAEEAGSMASEMRIIIERGLQIRRYACDVLNDGSDLDLSVKINPALTIQESSEVDRTDGLTDNQRTNDDRRLES